MNNLNMRRVLKGRTLRAADGLAPVQPPATPAAPAQPNSLLSNPGYSMINNPGYSMINNPGASLLSHPDTPSASILPAGGAGSPTYTMQGSIPFGQPVTGRSVQQANGGYQEAQRNPKKRPVEPFGLREGGEIHADLGGMWANAKRAVTGQAPETPSEALARRLNRPAPVPAPAQPAPAQPAPAPAQPAPQPAAPMGNQTVIDSRMKAAGLRNGGTLRTGHGGDVPGTGTGDKIPAKYEPGEFVVSNDMLDAQPSLRGHLQSLRKDVLAEKGMTPEQADAKALGHGTGLRAQVGVTPVDPQAAGMTADEWANRGSPVENQKIAIATMGANQAAKNAADQQVTDTINNAPAVLAQAQKESRKRQLFAAGDLANATAKSEAAESPRAHARAVQAYNLRDTNQATASMAGDVRGRLKNGDDAGAFGATLRGAGNVATGYLQDTGRALGDLAAGEGDSTVGRFINGLTGGDAKKPMAPPTTPTQASYSNEGRNRPTPAITPKAPKTLRGADGRGYLPETVSDDDRLQSDKALNSVFGNRGGPQNADANLQKLGSNAGLRDTANAAWAQRGAGIRVDTQANGNPVFSNSTAPEKMQYVDTKGNPTSEYRNTQQYAEGVGVAKRDKALADKMEHDRLVQEAGSSNAAYSGPAQRRLAQEQVTNNQAIEKDKTAALREGHQLDYEGRMAPVLLAQQNQKYIQQVMASSGVNGDPRKAVAALTSQGMGHLTKDLREQIASEQSARAADQADGTARAKAMDDSFKGRFEKVNEKGETVEDDAAAKIAADQFRLATEGKNLTPDQIAEHHHNAMMHAKLVQRLQGKARLRDDGFVNRLNPFGDNRSVPSNLPADLTRSTVNWFDGARTGHGIEKGDHYLGDPSLNIAIPADTPDDELQYLASLKKQRAADKAKLRN